MNKSIPHRALIALAFVFTLAQGAARAQEAHDDLILGSPGSVSNGAAAYAGHCASCHGPIAVDGSGNPFADRRLEPQTVYRMIAPGTPHGGGEQPGFAGKLSPEQRWDIVSFLLSLQPAMESD